MALSVSDVSNVAVWIGKLGEERQNNVEPNWHLVGLTVDALVADWTQLKAAIDAIDALTGGDDLADAQVLSAAAKAASEAVLA